MSARVRSWPRAVALGAVIACAVARGETSQPRVVPITAGGGAAAVVVKPSANVPRLVPITAADLARAPERIAGTLPRGGGVAAGPPLVAISFAPVATSPVARSPVAPIASLPLEPAAASAPAVRPALPAVASSTPLPIPTPPVVPPRAIPAPAAIATTPPAPAASHVPVPTVPRAAVPPQPAPPPHQPVPAPLQPAARHPESAVASSQPARAPPQPAPPQPAPPQSPPAAPASTPAASGKPVDAITIGTFNIQVFGESKISKPQVVDVLARVVRGFDVVAIQEVRAKSDGVIPQFVSAVNATGGRYRHVIGPRLGRTSSKEQYTFIYDSDRIELDPSSVGTVPNPGDRLHRPPLHARFRVRTNPPEAGFTFWLVDTHTDPDEVRQEVDALAAVFMEMKALRPEEDDVILLGDLNAGPPQFGRIKQIPGVGWAVSGVTTNTRRTKTYDNLVFDRGATSEYTGRWGVLDLQNTFGLSLDKALEVSDHNPVWATFSPWESRQVAGQPGLSR